MSPVIKRGILCLLQLQPVHILILVVFAGSIIVSFSTTWLAVIWFMSATLATLIIGVLPVLTFVILVAPNHYIGSSVIPDRVTNFQKKLKV